MPSASQDISTETPIVWSIAGLDNSGCAGLLADARVLQNFGAHLCAIASCTTAQNASQCLQISPLDATLMAEQLRSLQPDFMPHAIKIGALASNAAIQLVSECIREFDCPVVHDPVLATSSGMAFLSDEDIQQLLTELLPQVSILTPNISEAEQLTGIAIRSPTDVERAAAQLLTIGLGSVLIKGGHLAPDDADVCDYWSDGVRHFWLRHPLQDNPNTRGSGCALSSAIAASLATDPNRNDWPDIASAVVRGTAYISRAIELAKPIQPSTNKSAGLNDTPVRGPVSNEEGTIELRHLPRLSEHFQAEDVQFSACDVAALGLYPVVDDVSWLGKLLPLGIQTIQLRIKDQSDSFLRQQIQQAVELQNQYGCRLFINDHWQLALKYGAYGVHLGQEDLNGADLVAIAQAGLRLGVSTHSWFELARAHALSPSYIAFGPVYATTTKTMRFVPQGLQRLREWVTLLAERYPLVAIGGIDTSNAAEVLRTGVGSVAVVRAITEAPDTQVAVQDLQRLVDVA
ncbi:MAG: thiamine phosphate synthase [Pseudomonadales bacterium]